MYRVSLNGMIKMINFCFFLIFMELVQHFVIGFALRIVCKKKLTETKRVNKPVKSLNSSYK